MTTDLSTDTFALLRTMFGAAGHLWSIGTLSAFMALETTGTAEATPGGLILDAPDLKARLRGTPLLLAFETISSDPRSWNHGIAICAAGSTALTGRPAQVTRLAADSGAIDPADRDRPVLDLGLGQGPVTTLFRPAPHHLGAASSTSGLTWDEARPAIQALSGVWIIDTPALRLERRADPGSMPVHSISTTLERGIVHSSATPVPEGWFPFAHVFPPHPARSRPGSPAAFDPQTHQRFQQIMAAHARPDLWHLKQDVLRQIREGRFDPPEIDRHRGAVIRVTLRQYLHVHGTPPPMAWLSRFDKPLMRALEEEGL